MSKEKDFLIKEGIAVQTKDLREWKTILSLEAFRHLETYVLGMNENINIKSGFDIFRGSSISFYVHNMAIKKYTNDSFN
jgi:hypothetical protein